MSNNFWQNMPHFSAPNFNPQINSRIIRPHLSEHSTNIPPCFNAFHQSRFNPPVCNMGSQFAPYRSLNRPNLAFPPPPPLRPNQQFMFEELQSNMLHSDRPSNVMPQNEHSTLPSFIREASSNIGKSSDDDRISNWTSNVETRIKKDKEKKHNNTLTISNVQKQLLEYATAIQDLEKNNESLSQCNDPQRNEELCDLCTRLKDKITNFQEIFNEEYIMQIKTLIMDRRKKRKQMKEKKKLKRKKWQKTKEEFKEKERMIDLQLQQVRDKEKGKMNECKLKQEADSVLREVRTKQSEAKAMLRLLESVDKLRQARKTKGEAHGYVASPKADTFFQNLKAECDSLISNHISLYKCEEKTLSVMMEESRPVQCSKGAASEADIKKLKEQLHVALFGEPPSAASDAANDIQEFINIRREWDEYLTNTDDALSSAVPLAWVTPNSEPNEDWKHFLQS